MVSISNTNDSSRGFGVGISLETNRAYFVLITHRAGQCGIQWQPILFVSKPLSHKHRLQYDKHINVKYDVYFQNMSVLSVQVQGVGCDRVYYKISPARLQVILRLIGLPRLVLNHSRVKTSGSVIFTRETQHNRSSMAYQRTF